MNAADRHARALGFKRDVELAMRFTREGHQDLAVQDETFRAAGLRVAVLTFRPDCIRDYLLDEMGISARVSALNSSVVIVVPEPRSLDAVMRALQGTFVVSAEKGHVIRVLKPAVRIDARTTDATDEYGLRGPKP